MASVVHDHSSHFCLPGLIHLIGCRHTCQLNAVVAELAVPLQHFAERNHYLTELCYLDF